MFPGIRLTKSEARLLPKRRPFLRGAKRGSGLSTRPSGEVLAWLLLPKRVFKCQFLYVWKSFCEVRLSQLLCIDWLLAWNVVSVRSGTQQCDTPSERASWYVHPVPSALYPKQPLEQSLAAQPPRHPTDHLVYSDGLSPLTFV